MATQLIDINKDKIRLCCVIPDIGNYHHVRMQALSKIRKLETYCIEISDTSCDKEFKYKQNPSQETYITQTLFTKIPQNKIPVKKLIIALKKALYLIHPV
jgi:hypothetical protein